MAEAQPKDSGGEDQFRTHVKKADVPKKVVFHVLRVIFKAPQTPKSFKLGDIVRIQKEGSPIYKIYKVEEDVESGYMYQITDNGLVVQEGGQPKWYKEDDLLLG